jgi:hypothetical protein
MFEPLRSLETVPKIRNQIDSCSLQMQSNKGRTIAIAAMIASVLSKTRTPAIAWEAFPDNDNNLIAQMYELLSWISKKKMKG